MGKSCSKSNTQTSPIESKEQPPQPFRVVIVGTSSGGADQLACKWKDLDFSKILNKAENEDLLIHLTKLGNSDNFHADALVMVYDLTNNATYTRVHSEDFHSHLNNFLLTHYTIRVFYGDNFKEWSEKKNGENFVLQEELDELKEGDDSAILCLVGNTNGPDTSDQLKQVIDKIREKRKKSSDNVLLHKG